MTNNVNVVEMIGKCTEVVEQYVQESVVLANNKIQNKEKIEKVRNSGDFVINTMEYHLAREVPSLVETIENFFDLTKTTIDVEKIELTKQGDTPLELEYTVHVVVNKSMVEPYKFTLDLPYSYLMIKIQDSFSLVNRMYNHYNVWSLYTDFALNNDELSNEISTYINKKFADKYLIIDSKTIVCKITLEGTLEIIIENIDFYHYEGKIIPQTGELVISLQKSNSDIVDIVQKHNKNSNLLDILPLTTSIKCEVVKAMLAVFNEIDFDYVLHELQYELDFKDNSVLLDLSYGVNIENEVKQISHSFTFRLDENFQLIK